MKKILSFLLLFSIAIGYSQNYVAVTDKCPLISFSETNLQNISANKADIKLTQTSSQVIVNIIGGGNQAIYWSVAQARAYGYSLDSLYNHILDILKVQCDTSGGGGVSQTLSISGDTLSISGGNSVVLPVYVQVDSTIITSYDVLNSQNAPPGSPATGDTYLVGTSPSGAWVGHAKDIAEWNGSSWDFTDGVQGDFLYNATTALTYIFRSGNWVQTSGIPALHNGNNISSELKIGTNNARSLTFETNNVNRGRFDSIGRFHIYNLPTSSTSDTFVTKSDLSGKLTKVGKSTFLSGVGVGDVSQSALDDSIDRIQTAINTKQNTLVSGTNIKTVNSTTLLGSGNIRVQDSFFVALNTTRDSTIFTSVINGVQYRTPIRDSVGGGGSTTIATAPTMIYVSKSGNDATGTKGDITKPFLTLTAANAVASKLDVVYVYPGIYTEQLIIKDSVYYVSAVWGAAIINHNGTSNTFAVVTRQSNYVEDSIEIGLCSFYGFSITNSTSESTLKIRAKNIDFHVKYMQVKSKNVTYSCKFQLSNTTSTSYSTFSADRIDCISIGPGATLGFDGSNYVIPQGVKAADRMPTFEAKTVNFIYGGVQALDYIGWQNWNYKIDVVNDLDITTTAGEKVYHQNCNGEIGFYKSIRTGSEGNNSTSIYIEGGISNLKIGRYYSEGQERVIYNRNLYLTSGLGCRNIVEFGVCETDGLFFFNEESPSNAYTSVSFKVLKRINVKNTAYFYIFANASCNTTLKLHCDYATNNGTESLIRPYQTGNGTVRLMLSGYYENTNATTSTVINDDATSATFNYLFDGTFIAKTNASAGTKGWINTGSNRTFYQIGNVGVTHTNIGAGTPTVVGNAVILNTGL